MNNFEYSSLPFQNHCDKNVSGLRRQNEAASEQKRKQHNID